MFTNKENTPCHIFIISVIGNFANLADFSIYSVVIIIFLIFLLFMSLIFTEIIEINICNLSYNTKRNIDNRAKIDNMFVENNDSTFSSINSANEENEKNNSGITSGRDSLNFWEYYNYNIIIHKSIIFLLIILLMKIFF